MTWITGFVRSGTTSAWVGSQPYLRGLPWFVGAGRERWLGVSAFAGIALLYGTVVALLAIFGHGYLPFRLWNARLYHPVASSASACTLFGVGLFLHEALDYLTHHKFVPKHQREHPYDEADQDRQPYFPEGEWPE